MSRPASLFQTPERQQADRKAKRDAVLLVAVQMFNERGFHHTSLDDVAARLGISKPTIYHYLGNKDQILLECVKSGLDQLMEAAQASRKAPGSGADRLCTFLTRYAEANMGDFGRCVIRTAEEDLEPESREKLLAIKRQIDTAMRAIIEEGIADGSILPCDSRLLAFALAGALNWPARWYKPEGSQTRQDLAQSLVSVLARGFLAQAAGA